MDETLEQRIEKAADDARRAWLSTADTIALWEVVNDADKADWRNVVRPLVERIVELERTQQRSATDSEREMAEMRDNLIAAQTAGRDQAAEIERLRDELIDMNGERNESHRAAKRCADEAREMRFELEKQTKRADDADDEITDLRTTVRVIVGMIAPRGQS